MEPYHRPAQLGTLVRGGCMLVVAAGLERPQPQTPVVLWAEGLGTVLFWGRDSG